MTDMETIPTSGSGSTGSDSDPAEGTGAAAGSGWRSWLRGSGAGFGSGRSETTRDPLRRLLLVSLGLMGIAIALVFIAVARGPEISITDEPAHAGYLYMMAHGEVPAKGTLVPEEIRYEWYCHDLQASTGSTSCTGFNASTFQTTAQVYTFGDPPVYYVVTGVLIRAISPLVPGTHNFITVGRDLGALWLFGGMLVLYLAARKFRIAPPYAFAAAALLPLCPGVLASTSQITSDAPSALAGAIGLYVLARIIIDKRMGFVVPFAATVLTTGTKILNGMPLLVVGGVTFFIAAAALYRRDWRPAIRPLLISVATVVGFVLTFEGWNVYQNHRGATNWVNPNLANGTSLTGSPVGDLLSNTFGTFQRLTTAYWLPASINGETVTIWATLLCVVLVAGPLMVMTASRAHSWGWTLGAGTFIGITAVALAVEAQVFTADDEYFVNVAPRYALAFLPWAILCLAVVAARRRLLKSTYAFVALGLVVLLLAETGVFTLGPALVSNASYLVG
jgi:hypothetical protein